MRSELAAANVKIHSILKSTAIGQLVGKKYELALKAIDSTVNRYLKELGDLCIKAVQEAIDFSRPGGFEYIYFNEDGSVYTTRKTSAEGSPPSSFSGTLRASIERFVVGYGSNSIIIGVDDRLSDIPTKYYVPLNRKGSRIFKKNPIKQQLKEAGRAGYRGAIILGEPKHGAKTAQEYAGFLEHGFTVKGMFHQRPFLREAVKKTMDFYKSEFYSLMKDEVNSTVKAKKGVVIFNMTFKGTGVTS
jgi:hypothetical protein